MKKTIICLTLVGLVALGGQASAELCTIDNVPAATLLLPYFEVDLANTQDGVTTLFSINNASAAPALAHVTVWSELSIPVFDFDVYLTGYDVQTINLRDVIADGVLPQTGSATPTETEEPGSITGGTAGDFSQAATNFVNPVTDEACGTSEGNAPWYSVPAITGNFLAHIQAWLTGQESPATNNCASLFGVNTDIARGYITVDNSNFCSLDFPSDDGYFVAGGEGNASNDNVLWGDYFIVDEAEDFAQGETLVHIEAGDAQFQGGPNGYTFYGRYTQSQGFLDDNREPLATNYAVRHATTFGGLPGGTDLLVWRDSADPGPVGEGASSPVACGTTPDWHPLESRQIVIFDEEENPVGQQEEEVSGVPPGEEQNPFPLETQRVDVDTAAGAGLQVPPGWAFGWLYLNLNLNETVAWDVGRADSTSAQAWVTAVTSAFGRFSVGLDAIQLDSACDPFTGEIGEGGVVGPVDG